MNQLDIITCQPELLNSPLNNSILKIAQDKRLIEIEIHNLRDFSENKHKKIDDYAFGGGGGMVLKIEPIYKCLEFIKNQREVNEVIYMSPDGEKLNQKMSNELSLKENLVIICGHYKGIDERIRENLITREISIGDYVLTGGELPAAILIDSIIRLIPGVVSNESAALSDSFQDNLLGHPNYTRPSEFNGWKVPKVLLSGDQKKIDEWRIKKSYEKTKKERPDLLDE
ncbi:MAG: tRNA (guanosine(37)-N1)-methyltransferase TrmD [Cytophagia bacterium]|jgi:tRNA (guanine37-N1)-methyltransferase|nr:tRNA (guanosine(37)-N1)-methyltransferase TrmD [Cytophagia bacterium]